MLFQTLKSLLFASSQKAEKETTKAFVLRLLREKQFDQARVALAPALKESNPEPELLSLMGEVEFHLNDLTAAENLFLSALKQQPGLASAHHGLSLVYYANNRLDDALAQSYFARNCAPSEPRILAQLGLCLVSRNTFGPARDVLRQAVLADPENVPALNNLGIACHALMDYGDALYFFRRALAINPKYVPAHENLRSLFGIDSFDTEYDSNTNALRSELHLSEHNIEVGNNEPSLADLEDQYDQDPDNTHVALQLVHRYTKELQLEPARDVLNLSLARHPKDLSLLQQAGQLAKSLGQLNKARSNYELALEIDPSNVKTLLGLVDALRSLDLHEDALQYAETAVSTTENANTLIQLAFSQVNACRYQDALASCQRVEDLQPEYAPFLTTTRAMCHAYIGNFDEALKYIDIAETYEKGNLSFAIFRGMINLLLENYAEGWDSYRFRKFSETKQMRLLPYRIWEGEHLEGKTVLVLAEQGLGDQVMFASCLPDLLALKPKKILLESHQRVFKTLERSFPQIEAFSSTQSDFDWIPNDLTPDFYIQIADLPRYFRRCSKDFPLHNGYLIADPSRVAFWKDRLTALGPQMKVGITWRGGLQQTRRAIRSLSLEQLAPIFDVPDVVFVNLQYGQVSDEIKIFSRSHGVNIIDWPEAIADLDEFAALITALDLVITVCNTTVHYTGALSKSCWVMAPFIPEWRYGLRGSSMRWYPSVRMFRQDKSCTWDAVLDDVRIALTDFAHPIVS